MSNNLTLGPAQIWANDVASINLALQELSNRIDEIKGLRGRTELWDRTQTSAPVVSSDAVDLGSLEDRESLYHLTYLSMGVNGLVVLAPGTSYIEISDMMRQQINLATPASLQARVVVGGWGTESGSGKGVAMTDETGAVLAEVTWDGNSEGTMVGTFTAITDTDDTLSRIYAKASSATESLILRSIAVEMRFAILNL